MIIKIKREASIRFHAAPLPPPPKKKGSTFINLLQTCLPKHEMMIQKVQKSTSDHLDAAMIVGAAPNTEGDQQYSLGAVFQVSLAQGP